LAAAASRQAVNQKSDCLDNLSHGSVQPLRNGSVHVRLLFIEAEAGLQNADGGKV